MPLVRELFPQQHTGSFCPANGSTWVASKKLDHYNFGYIAKEAGRASCPYRCLKGRASASGRERSSPPPLRTVTHVPVDTAGLGRLDHGDDAAHRFVLVFRKEEPCLLCVAPPESWNSVGILFVPCFRLGVRKTQNRFSRFSPRCGCSSVTFVHFFALIFLCCAVVQHCAALGVSWLLWPRRDLRICGLARPF